MGRAARSGGGLRLRLGLRPRAGACSVAEPADFDFASAADFPAGDAGSTCLADCSLPVGGSVLALGSATAGFFSAVVFADVSAFLIFAGFSAVFASDFSLSGVFASAMETKRKGKLA